MIRIQRVYEALASDASPRFLVDRLWPRGIAKKDLNLTAWLRDVAPSNELRKWYGHDPEKWDEFRRRYFTQLEDAPASWQPLLEAAQSGDITLVYSSKEREINNAAALRQFLEAKLQGPQG